jgi:cold shock CspA family protein
MAKRYDGALKKWNTERGFGFIVADDGGQELFVHISAFPRDGQLPATGERLSFEIEPDRDGKKRAVQVRRPGAVQPGPAHMARRSSVRGSGSQPGSKRGFGRTLIGLIIVAALGWYGYRHYANRVALIQAAPQSVIEPSAMSATLPRSAEPGRDSFQCDGRKYCSQMTSCKEAKLFLKNCPGVEMDGDHDGVPCEQQWCTSPFAN